MTLKPENYLDIMKVNPCIENEVSSSQRSKERTETRHTEKQTDREM